MKACFLNLLGKLGYTRICEKCLKGYTSQKRTGTTKVCNKKAAGLLINIASHMALLFSSM